jgi:hypothetical protein
LLTRRRQRNPQGSTALMCPKAVRRLGKTSDVRLYDAETMSRGEQLEEDIVRHQKERL